MASVFLTVKTCLGPWLPWDRQPPATAFSNSSQLGFVNALEAKCPAARVYPESAQAASQHADELRIAFDGDSRTVVDGPFAETRELVSGFWIWEVKDMAEAVEWAKRCPNPMPGPSDLELRPVYEIADFGEAVTPEAAAIHDANREKLENR